MYNWFHRLIYRLRRYELLQVLAAIFIVVVLSATAVTYFEKYSNSQIPDIWHGLWWALVTMTTVGYGDVVPTTTAGRLIASVVMLSGISLLSIFTAAVSTTVITKRLREGRGLSKIRMKNHILILGWNPFGEDLIRDVVEAAIRENRTIVLVNKMKQESFEALINKFRNIQIKFVFGDFSDEDVLQRANIKFAFAAVILPDESDLKKPKSDERTILACLTVKSVEPKVKVIAHILERTNEAHLRRANADQIVVTNRYSGFFLANHIIAPGIPETIDVLLDGRKGIRLSRRKLPKVWIDKTFSEAHSALKNSDDVILIGFIKEEPEIKLDELLSDDFSAIDMFIRNKLERSGKGLAKHSQIEVNLNPKADYLISEKDIAVVIEKVKK